MPQCAPSRTPVITRRSWSFAEPRARAGITEGAHLDPSEIERRRKDLDMAKDFLSERGIEAKTIAPQDDPGDVVVDVVTDADLAVVGSGGLIPSSVCSWVGQLEDRPSCTVRCPRCR
jgi:hypothetical protein